MKTLSEDFLSQFERVEWEYPIENKDTIRFQIEFSEDYYTTNDIPIDGVNSYYEFLGCRMAINVWDEDETIDNPINTWDDLPFEIEGLFVMDEQNPISFLIVSKNSEYLGSEPGEDHHHEDFNNLGDLLIYLDEIQEVDLLSGLKDARIYGEIHQSSAGNSILQTDNEVSYPIEIIMPRLSDSLDGGTIVKWNKKCGEIVQEGDIIAEIETDKSVMDFESFYNGVISEIIVQEGEFTKSGNLICILTKIK